MVLGRLLRVDSEHGKLEWIAGAAANSQDGGLDLGQDSVSIASDTSFPIMPASRKVSASADTLCVADRR
jgi:hypothetical protein